MIKVNIGIDVGGMSIKAGLVDDLGNIIYRDKVKSNSLIGNDLLVSLLITLCDKLFLYASENNLQICGIGIGVPGTVNNKKMSLDYAPNLKVKNLSLKDALEKYKIPVYISNDANCAALAEQKFGIAKQYSDVILLTLGTGIGGGVVINNQLFEGFEGKGAELGHMVLKLGGKKCGCGRKGCFEAYASASALLRYTKEEMRHNKNSLMWEYCEGNINNVSGLTSFECAKKDDESANKVVDKYIMYLGEGILNYCNIFRPEAIVLGGGVSSQKDYLINKVEKYVADRNYGLMNSRKVDILVATLGNDAGIIGAAHLLKIE